MEGRWREGQCAAKMVCAASRGREGGGGGATPLTSRSPSPPARTAQRTHTPTQTDDMSSSSSSSSSHSRRGDGGSGASTSASSSSSAKGQHGGEIVTIQCGTIANWIGTQFHLLQVSARAAAAAPTSHSRAQMIRSDNSTLDTLTAVRRKHRCALCG